MNAPVNVLAFREAKSLVRSPRLRLAAILGSVRFQLSTALLIGVPMPAIVRNSYEQVREDTLNYDTTIIGTTAAIILGYLIYRKVTSLPGTNALLNQLPGFVLSYLVIAAFFFALRLDFSRQQFVLSFLFVTFFLFALTFLQARVRRPVYGLVPGGRANALARIPYVDWIRFDSPGQAKAARSIPLVADLHDGGLSPQWERFLAEEAISGRRVFNAKQLKESLEGQVEISHLSENSFGHLAPDSLYAPAKFYIDTLIAAVALTVLSPLLLLIALVIRLTSPGPAIFRQKRMGYRGKVFTLYKFRSMRHANHTGPAAARDMTQTDDDRVTAFGRFIRQTRIDELPQLINILRGEMSLVGPRPETLALSALYEAEMPFYRYRHIVRPGITGWAQIKQGHVTDVDAVREKLEYDFYYVRNFSVWLDLLIVIQTVRVMLTGLGAR